MCRRSRGGRSWDRWRRWASPTRAPAGSSCDCGARGSSPPAAAGGRRATSCLRDRSRSSTRSRAARPRTRPRWDGTFDALIVQIPAESRAYREQLRRHAAYAGFGTVLPGLLVAPFPESMSALAPLLARVPGDASVTPVRLVPDPENAAILAAHAWDLETMAAVLRAEAARMTAAAEGAEASPPEGAAALSLLWRSIGPFFEVLSASPPLPAQAAAARLAAGRGARRLRAARDAGRGARAQVRRAAGTRGRLKVALMARLGPRRGAWDVAAVQCSGRPAGGLGPAARTITPRRPRRPPRGRRPSAGPAPRSSPGRSA